MLFRFTLDNVTEGEHVLTYNPKGWEDTELVVRRDEKYIGLFFDYTLKLDFFCGAGKEYIDNIFDTQGPEAEVSILIEIDCNESGTFETLYTGKLNLASYERIYEAPEFTRVNIEQAGIIQTIKNRLDTVVNLNKLETLDGTALTDFTYGPYDLTLHSKAIVFRSLLDIDGTASNTNSLPSLGGFLYNLMFEFPFEQISYDDLQGLAVPTDPYMASDANPPEFAFVNGLGENIIVDFSYNFTGSVTEIADQSRNYASVGVFYKVAANFGDVGSTALVSYSGQSASAGVSTITNISTSGLLSGISIPDGHKLWVYIQFTNLTTTSGGAIYTQGVTTNFTICNISISRSTTTDATTCKAFAVYEAGARISQAITDSTDSFRSEFLGRKNAQPYAESQNGCGSFMAITNGFQIRKFPIADRPIYISMRDYFDSLNALFNMGLGIEESGGNYYIRIEPKEYFYDTEALFQIENIRNFTIRAAENLYINNIEIGYDKWESEEVNGLDEFNTKRKYTVKLKSLGQGLVHTSKLIASAYAIEFTRRNQYVDSNTVDYKFDNDNFLICLNRSVDGSNIPTELDTAEKDENFTNVTNLISPETIYNLRLSPGRIIKSWLKTIAASVIKANATLKDILFSYGEGNYKLTSQGTDFCDPGNAELIDEGEDIELLVPNTNGEYEPIYVPEIIEFEKELSYTEYKLIKANPTKCLEVSPTNSNFIKGFIQEIRYQPVTGIAQFKLLRAYALAEECSHEYVEEGYVECGYVE